MISPLPPSQEDSRAATAPRTRTAEEAAAVIGGNCKASWLKRLARERKIPSHWIGGSYGFTDADIEAIIAFCARPARHEAPAPAKAATARRKAASQAAPVFPLAPAGTVQLQARAPRKQGAA